jgi:hypothetical protein
MNRGYLEMKDKNAPVFFLSGHEDQIMMMVGNIPEGSEEQVRQAIEELTRERFGDKVQGSSVERNDVQKDRFDITVVMGPYANQHQFETATRHIIRFMENELGSQRAAFSTVN